MSTVNHRLYYAIQAVGIAPNGTNSFTAAHGVQTVGMNTKFNLQQVFEVGQLAIYENYENLPDIEVSMEKVLDGYPLLWHLSTYGASDATLTGRQNQRATIALSIFGDTQLSASGTPIQQCVCSGMYPQQISFDFKVDGPATESLTLVGNNKVWMTGGFTFTGGFTNTDVPHAAEGVDLRQHFQMGLCKFPLDIPGISSSGTNDMATNGLYGVHFDHIKANTNLGRELMLEIGQKSPYFRYVNFPVEVHSEFEILSVQGDMVQATEAGVIDGSGNNLASQHIYLQTLEGTKIDLGTQNKMSGVTYNVSAASRGQNSKATYSYLTFNDFTVTHPQDPTPGLAG